MSDMMPTLHTLDRSWGDLPDFITVRYGDKYAGSEGTLYDLCECDTGTEPYSHQVVGNAVVYETLITDMGGITAHTLSQHYNEGCRSYDGLMAAMTKAYGEEKMGEGLFAPVTVLFLQRPPA